MIHRYRWSLSVIEFYRADGSKANLFYERPSVPEPRTPRLERVADGEERLWQAMGLVGLLASAFLVIGWMT